MCINWVSCHSHSCLLHLRLDKRVVATTKYALNIIEKGSKCQWFEAAVEQWVNDIQKLCYAYTKLIATKHVLGTFKNSSIYNSSFLYYLNLS